VGLTFSFFVAILYGLLRGQWLQGVLGGIALAMSMLPEEFPLVLTVFMVMGAWRLSRSHVLTRRTAAIETLGAATVLCTDKTGTLTHNAMAVAHLQSESDVWRSGESPARILESRGLALLLETAVLASEPHALDPMERSLVDLAADARSLTATDMVPARTYPLRPQLLAITQAWNVPSTPAARIAAKGAPEAIARLCRLDERSTRALTARVDELARSGMRVLAVANGTHPADALPDEATQLTLQLAGLVGFADPLRPAVPAAVRECHAAGIRVVMITGDYPQTAQAIARQAGIEQDAVLTGDEMQRLAADELAARLPHTNVFARISHQQKLRLVEIFKANGDVVAMTGDGVNDAPALKAAHIGIAMGGRGTDVAREAATLVLLDDDFGSIVRAIRLGRRIYDNLRKACGYILAIHVPIAGVALLPVLFGGPLILTPMLIAFLELIIDPACSVVFEAEPEEGDIMRRSPRDPERALVSRSLALWSLSQGCAALVLVGAVFFYASAQDLPHEEIRALTFLALVGANIALIFVNRTFGASPLALLRRPHPALWWGLGIALGVLAVLFAWPAARGFLELGPLHPDDFAVCLLVVVLLLAILQAAKRVWRGALHA
jgi:Ca2+-transporting ATPase